MIESMATIFALCGLSMLLWNTGRLFLPLPAGALPPPAWLTGWFAVGGVYFLLAGGIISVVHPTLDNVRLGGGLFVSMLAGILAKWLWDALLLKPFKLETMPLMGAFVVAPLIVTATWGTLTGGPTLHTILLCFSNGFFWQTIFSDLVKNKGRG